MKRLFLNFACLNATQVICRSAMYSSVFVDAPSYFWQVFLISSSGPAELCLHLVFCLFSARESQPALLLVASPSHIYAVFSLDCYDLYCCACHCSWSGTPLCQYCFKRIAFYTCNPSTCIARHCDISKTIRIFLEVLSVRAGTTPARHFSTAFWALLCMVAMEVVAVFLFDANLANVSVCSLQGAARLGA